MSPQPLAILLVEENRELRQQLERDLRSRGCRVTAVPDVVGGLEAIVLGGFDAVVSDAVMLPRGGVWLWREATALRPELRGRFFYCGADLLPDSFDGPVQTERFLSKPLDLNALWAEIVAVADQRESRLS